MDRKKFIRTATLGAAGLGILSSCSGKAGQDPEQTVSNGKTYSWKMVTSWPPNFPILGEGARLLADWVEQMSAGRLKIKVYGGGELVPPLEAFDAVRSGSVHLYSGAAYYWAGKVPASQFFTSVPFGLRAQQMNTWLYAGEGLKLWEELYADFNLIPMPGGNTGLQMGGWFNRKVESTADLKGLKMRMPGLGGKVLEKAGGTPVLSAGSEIYTNLERGVIDATEWVGPYHDYLMGFHEIADYYYYPGWHEPSGTLEITCNKSAFEQLPADLQAIVRAACARLDSWTLAQFEYQNAIYLKKIREETGVQILPFPDEVLADLRKYSKEVLEQLADTDAFSKKVYDSLERFREQAAPWTGLINFEF